MSHVVPDRKLETVLHECIRRTLKAIRARREGGRARGTSETKAQPKGRHIPASVRRAVWRRDQGRCAFVSDDGRQCGATHLPQVDHLQPFSLGGPPTLANLALRCAVHNRYHCETEMHSG